MLNTIKKSALRSVIPFGTSCSRSKMGARRFSGTTVMHDTGISSLRATCIAEEVFSKKISGRDFLLAYFVSDYLQKFTRLPFDFCVTDYYLKVPSTKWFQFMHDDMYMTSVIHIDNEEVYDIIRQHKLKHFLLGYIRHNCDDFLIVNNLSLTSEVKSVVKDVLWKSDSRQKVSYVTNQLAKDPKIFAIGFIQKKNK